MTVRNAMILLCFAAAPAAAQPRAGAPARTAPVRPAPVAARPIIPTIEKDAVPEACRGRVDAAQGSTPAALSARIGLASCLAEVRLAPIQMVDSDLCKQEVETALAPSIQLYNQVIEYGAPVTKIVAEQAKSDLYTSTATRMTASIPALTGGESAIALHKMRSDQLTALLAPWYDAAAQASDHILVMVKATPKLATNPVVAAAVKTSRERVRRYEQIAAAAAAPAPAPEDQSASDEPSRSSSEDLSEK